jgi:protein-disulfide isomerase
VAQRSPSFPIVAALVAVALVIGASVVAAALLVRASLDRTTDGLVALQGAIEKLEIARAAASAVPTPRKGPDPARHYSIHTEGSPVEGNPSAKLAIVEFADFQCPFCARATGLVARIREEYGDRVRIVFKHLPLRIHPKAPAAHRAAEAAHRQGKFWEMYGLIFAHQGEMSEEKYLEYAASLGLDMERFRRDLASSEVQEKIDADAAEAARLGVPGTPSFFVNGRYLSGAQPFESFKKLIEQELGNSKA